MPVSVQVASVTVSIWLAGHVTLHEPLISLGLVKVSCTMPLQAGFTPLRLQALLPMFCSCGLVQAKSVLPVHTIGTPVKMVSKPKLVNESLVRAMISAD